MIVSTLQRAKRVVLISLIPAAVVACSAPAARTGESTTISQPARTIAGATPSVAQTQHSLIEGQARGEWLPDEAARDAAEKEKQDYLENRIDKSTILHSFHARSGEYWDCVDRFQQPGMKPGYVLATPPPHPPTPVYSAHGIPAVQSVLAHASEIDEDGNYMHCPEGTVPYRRVTAETLARFPTAAAYVHWKSYLHAPSAGRRASNRLHSDAKMQPDTTFGYATNVGGQEVDNWGMQSTLNLWNFYVANDADFSLTQTWIAYLGSGNDTETAEVGVMTFPNQTGNSNAVLFLYETDIDYQNKGNGYDSGYYLYDNGVYVNGDFSAYSSFGGAQYEVAFETEIYDGNVWLAYNGTWFAYFYGADYTHLTNDGGNLVQFGGQIFNSGSLTDPDDTEMGSGQYPVLFDGNGNSGNYTYATYQLHAQYINFSYNTIDISPAYGETYPNCYGYEPWVEDGNVGTSFFFGGIAYGECAE